nr:retrovirus-related Pol polyprotein from transposon TNT 1-94 [Tanacetum cinerariifolium]
MLCRPKPYYNELNMVAIGYKNPLCLTRAKQVQPTLYNGHEIIKDNHAPAIVHNTEDTLEIAKITMRKMNDKMKDPECVTRKVAQYVVDRKHDAIERKNLLIVNDNLIDECLSKEVFSVETNFELNVARFTEMNVAHTIVEARCLELEAELANLRDKSHHDNQEELINRFSQLETIKKQISQLQETRSDTDRTLKVRTADSHITKLTVQVTNLQGQNDLFRAENDKIKQHYKELYDSIKITRAKHIEKKQVTFTKPSDKLNSNIHKHVAKVKTQKTNVHMPPSTEVNSCPNASGSQPKSNTKTNRISRAKGVNKLPVEDQPRTNKSHLRTLNRVDSSSRLKRVMATACYTQNQSLIHTRHHKTLYELVHNKKPDLTFFRVFGAFCYTTNDSRDLGKLQPTADIGIFVGYAPSMKGYRIYNKRTRRIIETIHVQFDELTELIAPVHLGTGPTPNFLMPGQISSGLVPNPVPTTPYVPPTNKEMEILF